MPKFIVPHDLADEMQHGFRYDRDHPATRRFLERARGSAPWRPGCPRLLLRLAKQLGITVISPGYFDVLMTGFVRYDWPWRIAGALRVITQARGMPPDNRLHGEGVYVWSDGPRRHWSTPDSVMRPHAFGSPAGPAPIADAPLTPPPAAQPGRPLPPRGTVMHG